MKILLFYKILALLLAFVSLTMLPSVIISIIDGNFLVMNSFLFPIIIALALALLSIIICKKIKIHFSATDGFKIVSIAWILTSILGACPYIFSGVLPNFFDALFESVSGFTTTGATVFQDIECLPRGILFWRAMTHWLGGMGIVVMSVALLPLLGVGGFQLIKAETPGPEKSKITPTVTSTAKILWLIYMVLTLIQTILLMFGGMNWFDAITHAFATMATGGFGTKNASIGAYNSAYIDWVCTIFMLLAGFNFSLYFSTIKGKFKDLFDNTEARVYIIIVVVSSIFISLSLKPTYGSFGNALRYGAFQVASIITTTGFASANFDIWPEFAKAILFILMFIGGCSGSTAGGIKVIRHVVLWKQTGNEMRRLIYPRGVFSVRLNGKVGRKDVVYGVAGFVFLYMFLVMLNTLIIAIDGTELLCAFTTSLSLVGNIGPGFGATGPIHNYSFFPNYVKFFGSFSMLAGRLELWTLIVLIRKELYNR